MYYKLPIIFEPQPEGGYTVTSPLLPELLTEGDSVADALENVRNAAGGRPRDLPRARKVPSSLPHPRAPDRCRPGGDGRGRPIC